MNKSRRFDFTIGWPDVKTMSRLMHHFYACLGEVTDEMEQTQFGLNFIFAFIKGLKVFNATNGELDFELNFKDLDEWQDRLDCVNSLPSMVIFDHEEGLFSKITGYFINRLENCFEYEKCPQCKNPTYYGLSQSSHFYGLFYGSLKSIYGYILQIECLLVFRYDCCIFDKELHMTYNDLNSLIHQIGTTAERENEQRKKMSNDNLYKGLFYIREILNNMIFPQDKKR